MKKLLSILLTLTFAFAPIPATYAEGNNSDSVTFFESTDNLAKMKSYRMNQGLYGNFEMNEGEDKALGKFKLSILTDINNKDGFKGSTNSKITGTFDLTAEGKERPFDSLTATIRAQLKTIIDDGTYFRLDSLTLNANGVIEGDMMDFNDFKTEFEKEINKIKGTWIHIPDDYYGTEVNTFVPNEYSTFTDTDELKDELKNKGLKEFYKDMMTEALDSMNEGGSMPDDQYESFSNMIKEFHKTEFFTQNEIYSGSNKGLISFRLNKRKLMQFIESMAKAMNEEMLTTERIAMQNFFNKFSLFGLYSTDDKNRIFNSFKVRLILRDIEILSGLELGYTYKISKINEIGNIIAPIKSTPIDELDIEYLPKPMSSNYYDDSEWDFDDDLGSREGKANDAERKSEIGTLLSAIYQYQTSPTARGALPQCLLGTNPTPSAIPECDTDGSGVGIGNGSFEGAVEFGTPAGSSTYDCSTTIVPSYLREIPIDPDTAFDASSTGYWVCQDTTGVISRIYVIAESAEVYTDDGGCEIPGSTTPAMCVSG